MERFAQIDATEANASLNERHHDLLAKRGIRLETACTAGIRSISARDAKEILGFDPKSAGILFPYCHPLTGQVRSYRFRPDTPPIINGKPAKYLSPKGASNLLYFPPGIRAKLEDTSQPLYVTEGEFKVSALWQEGLTCVGSVGVYGWKGKGFDGQSQVIPDFDLIPMRNRVLTVVFDSDAAINRHVQQARHALGKELYRRGAAGVYTLDLPSDNGAKVGVDDFLVSHGISQLFDLVRIPMKSTPIPKQIGMQSEQIGNPRSRSEATLGFCS